MLFIGGRGGAWGGAPAGRPEWARLAEVGLGCSWTASWSRAMMSSWMRYSARKLRLRQ